MKRLSLMITLLLSLLGMSNAVQCEQSYTPHEVIFSGGVVNVTTDGFRQIETKAYSVGCPTFPYTPTGISFGGDTALTMNISTRAFPERCRMTDDTFTSFQALVIRTPGWTITPRRWRIRDIDAHTEGLVRWKEITGVFGVRDGTVVTPTTAISKDSILERIDAKISSADTGAIELTTLGDVTFPALKASKHYDCPLENTTKCDADFDFVKPIDTLVVLLTTFDKQLHAEHARPGNMSGVLIEDVKSECGCRCNLIDKGVRTVHIPTSTRGECKRKTTTAPVVACEEEGSNWCKKEFTVGWRGKGALLPSGNIGCDPVERTQAKYIQEYEAQLNPPV